MILKDNDEEENNGAADEIWDPIDDFLTNMQ